MYRLKHMPTQQESRPYSTERLKELIRLSTEEELHEFYIWSESDSDWIPLNQFRNQMARQSPSVKAPTANRHTPLDRRETQRGRDRDSELPQGLDVVFLRKQEIGNPKVLKPLVSSSSNRVPVKRPRTGIEQRKDFRFQIRLSVMISNGVKSFRTFTKNISLGGIQLGQDLPDGFQGKLDVFIFSPGISNPLHVSASPMGLEGETTNRLSLKDLDEVSRAEYQEWANQLKNYHASTFKKGRAS